MHSKNICGINEKKQRAGGNDEFGIEHNELEDICEISKQKFPVENNVGLELRKEVQEKDRKLDAI